MRNGERYSEGGREGGKEGGSIIYPLTRQQWCRRHRSCEAFLKRVGERGHLRSSGESEGSRLRRVTRNR